MFFLPSIFADYIVNTLFNWAEAGEKKLLHCQILTMSISIY